MDLRTYEPCLRQLDVTVIEPYIPIDVVCGVGSAAVLSGLESRETDIRFRKELPKSTMQLELDID